MEHVVTMKNVSKQFAGFSLKDVSLNIPKGYIMGLIGPNGAGKTTLIKLMMDLIHPNSGDIKVFGRSYDDFEKEIKAKIGFVYDEPGFYEDLTVKRMKQIIAPFYETWDDSKFEHYLKDFGVPKWKKIKHLSKGMKMKFSLALALSHDAELILLDEPTSGLDPSSRRELMDLLRDIMLDENKTILLSSHITTDLDRIADFVTYMNNGQIVFSEPKDELFETYGIVKGPNSINEEIHKYLIGLRKTDVGFEALTNSINEVEKADSGRLVIERPSLEDIVYYYEREVQ